MVARLRKRFALGGPFAGGLRRRRPSAHALPCIYGAKVRNVSGLSHYIWPASCLWSKVRAGDAADTLPRSGLDENGQRLPLAVVYFLKNSHAFGSILVACFRLAKEQ